MGESRAPEAPRSSSAATQRGHLRRLEHVGIDHAIYFITTCVADRRKQLARAEVAEIVREEFVAAPVRYGWTIGRYVLMPDHIHFFCAQGGARDPAPLSRFVGGFKQWTAKRIAPFLGTASGLWQREFFDHVLRRSESYEAKWTYVRENPVRAGLAKLAEDWPFAGEIAPLEFRTL